MEKTKKLIQELIRIRSVLDSFINEGEWDNELPSPMALTEEITDLILGQEYREALESIRYDSHVQLTCKALGITEKEYKWFKKQGDKLHAIYENNCNGDYRDEGDFIRAEHDIQVEIAKKLIDHNLHVYYQTDPRGATIYLDKEEIPENSYNNAHCIY